MSVQNMCTYTCECKKRVSDPLELLLQTIVNIYVGARNWNQVLWRVTGALNLSRLSSSLLQI